MGNMQMEMDMWLSTDVPGIGELRTFYQKNMERFPWAAMSGGGQSEHAGRYGRDAAQDGRDGWRAGGMQVMKMKSAGGAGALRRCRR